MTEVADTDTDDMIRALDRRVVRRSARRDFFKAAGGFAAGAAGMAALTACGGSGGGSTAAAQTAPSTDLDTQILNFALQLEYLEAQFYAYAANGAGLPDSMLSGTGTRGTLNATGAGKVPFSDPVVAAYAREIAADEINHVAFLRSALGSGAVAMPDIDISSTGVFTTLAVGAGLIAAGQTFSPYVSDNNFLLGAFIFEDVGVTAYKGASPLITNKTYLEAAAGILAVEAYHAGLIRTVLYAKGVDQAAIVAPVGVQNTQVIGATEAISNLRDSVDGSSDDDQGVTGSAPGNLATSISNIVPTDGNSIAYSRSVANVLSVVYGSRQSTTKGGFFPSGVNAGSDAFRTSGAN